MTQIGGVILAKKIFYSISRYKEIDGGEVRTGYFKREGQSVPNDFGLDLAVYRATDYSAATNWEEVKTWFVVDCECGLAIGQGGTKKEAIANSIERYEKVDKELYKKKCKECIEKYGPIPGHSIMYLH